MRLKKIVLAGLLALQASKEVEAAQQNFNVPYRFAVMQDGQLLHENKHRSYGFRVEILSDDDGVKTESFQNGRPSITASKGERYSVRLYNPLPVRVAVNLTVDGLNSISGQPSGISDGQKWMIDPYSSITIPGWQVSGGEARRFFFTEKPKSYAKWRGDETGKDLSANCGVIGAAYFWNQGELDQYYDQHPFYRYSEDSMSYLPRKKGCRAETFGTLGASKAAVGNDYYVNGAASSNCDLSAPAPAPQAQLKAGTGMGERESNPTTEVAFNYDTGMYSLDQALVIYYDFAPTPSPNPFPAVAYSPEMP